LAAILPALDTLPAGFGQAQSTSQTWSRSGYKADATPPPSGQWHYFGTADASTKSPARQANSAPQSRSITALEHEMAELVNRDRLDPANAAETRGRAQPLRWNERLAAVARQHSLDMLRQKFFAHVDREGRSPGTRVKAAGIGWQSVGENIAIYEQVAAAQAAFMNEPRFGHNHRSNILDPKYTDVGVGIVEAPNGWYYITQEFIELPRSLRASF
jgi:uncharacterized protein YkwD